MWVNLVNSSQNKKVESRKVNKRKKTSLIDFRGPNGLIGLFETTIQLSNKKLKNIRVFICQHFRLKWLTKKKTFKDIN